MITTFLLVSAREPPVRNPEILIGFSPLTTFYDVGILVSPFTVNRITRRVDVPKITRTHPYPPVSTLESTSSDPPPTDEKRVRSTTSHRSEHPRQHPSLSSEGPLPVRPLDPHVVHVFDLGPRDSHLTEKSSACQRSGINREIPGPLS